MSDGLEEFEYRQILLQENFSGRSLELTPYVVKLPFQLHGKQRVKKRALVFHNFQCLVTLKFWASRSLSTADLFNSLSAFASTFSGILDTLSN